MNPNRQIIFTKNLADVLSAVSGGLMMGTYAWQNNFFSGGGSPACDVICRQDCTPQVWKVVFGDPENVCNSCNKNAGIQIEVIRDNQFNVETYHDFDRRISFTYNFGTSNATVTAAMVAASILDQINNPAQWGHNHFGITASLDAADTNNETLLITIDDCTRFKVFNLPEATENTITEIYTGLDETASADWAARHFPLQVGLAGIPGAAPDESWQGCAKPCMITFQGCIDTCAGAAAFQNFAMHAMNPRVAVTIVFDQDSTDPNFLASLSLECTQNCRTTYSGASFGTLSAGTKSNTVLGHSCPVVVVSGDTALEYATKLQASILANCPEVSQCYVAFDGTNYTVTLSGDGSDNLLMAMTINSIVFAPEGVEGYSCGCFIDETPAYPFTGIFRYGTGLYIPITAAGNVAAIVSAIDAVLNPVSVVATAQRLVLAFPPATNTTVDCSQLELITEA